MILPGARRTANAMDSSHACSHFLHNPHSSAQIPLRFFPWIRRAPSSAPSTNRVAPLHNRSWPCDRFHAFCQSPSVHPANAWRIPDGPSTHTSLASPKVGATIAQSPSSPSSPSMIVAMMSSASPSEPVRVLPEPRPPRQYQTHPSPGGGVCSGRRISVRHRLALSSLRSGVGAAGEFRFELADGTVNVIGPVMVDT